MKIVVIGGTGLIGSRVVARLAEDGHEAIPASPRLGIDTVTGEGLAAALDGASVVVDVSNSRNFQYATARDFFGPSTDNLVEASRAAGVGHLVALSVVGTKELAEGGDPETTTAGYFLVKLGQEERIRASGIPYSIVHATQFFEFLASIADTSTKDGVVRLPQIAFQPMAADDVGAAVARVSEGSPANGIVEVGGPEEFRFEDAMRRVLAAADDPREIVTDPDRRYYGIAVSERTLVPASGARLGEVRLDDWLRQSAAAKQPVA